MIDILREIQQKLVQVEICIEELKDKILEKEDEIDDLKEQLDYKETNAEGEAQESTESE